MKECLIETARATYYFVALKTCNKHSCPTSKRPTLRAREAEKRLLRLLENTAGNSNAPLPPVRKLGDQLGLSFATVSRMLQRLAQQGLAWQHPNGRFFPMHAGPQAAQGLPIVVLGRQIQHWSRLYQEIIAIRDESIPAKLFQSI